MLRRYKHRRIQRRGWELALAGGRLPSGDQPMKVWVLNGH